MLRMHFTSDDVARTRIAPAPDPLWELVLAIHMLRGQRGDLLFADWRRRAAVALARIAVSGQLRLLSALTPNVGYFPDFLNPAAAMRGLEHGLEAIRSTPVAALARDLRRLSAPPSAAGPALRLLADGDPETLTALTGGMRCFYQAAIAPYQRTVDTAVERDRGLRIAAMADGGVDGLLSSLRPMADWARGELRVPCHPDQEIHLAGRGLLLVPSYFCIQHPMTLFEESLPPVLTYPVARSTETLLLRANPGLGALIGRTRAAVLDAIGTGCGTGELARRVGVSAASASEHAGVLRDAGLVASHRDGNRVMHQLTTLGLSLLNGS